MVIRRVLGLDTAEQTLIPDGILPLCSDRDRESILAVMSAVGAGRGRSHRGGAGGGAVGVGSSGATAGGSRTSGPGGGGCSRAPGPSRGPGVDSASDLKGKQKMSESRPPSPPRRGGAERVADRPPAGHKRPVAPETGRKKKQLRKIGQTEPCRGSFIEPLKFTFNRPPRRYDCRHPLRCFLLISVSCSFLFFFFVNAIRVLLQRDSFPEDLGVRPFAGDKVRTIGAARAWPIQGRGAFTASRRGPWATHQVRPWVHLSRDSTRRER